MCNPQLGWQCRNLGSAQSVLDRTLNGHCASIHIFLQKKPHELLKPLFFFLLCQHCLHHATFHSFLSLNKVCFIVDKLTSEGLNNDVMKECHSVHEGSGNIYLWLSFCAFAVSKTFFLKLDMTTFQMKMQHFCIFFCLRKFHV